MVENSVTLYWLISDNLDFLKSGSVNQWHLFLAMSFIYILLPLMHITCALTFHFKVREQYHYQNFRVPSFPQLMNNTVIIHTSKLNVNPGKRSVSWCKPWSIYCYMMFFTVTRLNNGLQLIFKLEIKVRLVVTKLYLVLRYGNVYFLSTCCDIISFILRKLFCN